jgi:hypothetical protein
MRRGEPQRRATAHFSDREFSELGETLGLGIAVSASRLVTIAEDRWQF